ncbi:hypothetical protein [Paenibacillus qinlingensis]|uniref:hypothetical protein n=1 Tax=Paenibacillus qinlingensis TaxID=1837343 RepID=UPI001565E903|nr:hypothetical protein [Paenibacillus qinlingensis]NQX61115.1 hypothetical protein [Paenibacillus qinlingensis]
MFTYSIADKKSSFIKGVFDLTASTFEDSPVQLIKSLDEMAHFRDYNAVINFLKEHYYLVEIIYAAMDRVHHFFPSESTFCEVDIISDEELESNKKLFLYIKSTLEPEEAMEKLDAFDDAWWIDIVPETNCKMIIDLEFL